MKVKIEIELNGSEDQELIQKVIGIFPQESATTATPAEPVKEKAAKQSKPEKAEEVKE